MTFRRVGHAQTAAVDQQMTIGRGHDYIATAPRRERFTVDRNPHRHSRQFCDPLQEAVGEFRCDVDDEQNRQRKISRNLRQHFCDCGWAAGRGSDRDDRRITVNKFRSRVGDDRGRLKAARLPAHGSPGDRPDARSHLDRADQFTFPHTSRLDPGRACRARRRHPPPARRRSAAPRRDDSKKKPPKWTWGSWPLCIQWR